MTAYLTVLADAADPHQEGAVHDSIIHQAAIAAVDADYVSVSGVPPLPLGAPVKICEGQRMWLGEVSRLHPEGIVQVRIVHMLVGTNELARMAGAFLGKRRAETPALS